MNTVPQKLLDATWLDEHGKTVAVRDALADGPTVVVFMRHFG